MSKELFRGVTYRLIAKDSPRNLLTHVVEIRTEQNAIREIVITPPDPSKGMEHVARTTSDFAKSFDVDLATNGSYFSPFHSNSPFDFYPHPGDPVNVLSTAINNGKRYSGPEKTGNRNILYWHGKKLVIFLDAQVPDDIETAIPGGVQLLNKGKQWEESPEHQPMYAPRTAIGWDRNQSHVWLVTVDGRQEGYSDGMQVKELADFMASLNAHDALALDGGGSSTLVVQTKGKFQILNAPFHTRVPMRERPVPNHLCLRLEHR